MQAVGRPWPSDDDDDQVLSQVVGGGEETTTPFSNIFPTTTLPTLGMLSYKHKDTFLLFHCRRKFHWRGTRCVKYVHGDLPFICVVTGLLLMLIILIPLHLRFQLTRPIHSFLYHYMANQGLPRLWNPNY